MTYKLSKLAHIKTVVSDAEKSYQILKNIFGAEKLREDFINSHVKLITVGLGDFVLHFIEPLSNNGLWFDHLQKYGPGIFSLSFLVEKLADLIENLTIKEKIIPIFSIEGKNKEDLGGIPLNFLNTHAKTRLILNTIGILGFHLELGDIPSNDDFTFPTTQYVTGSDRLIGDASTMMHFELVTPNANDAYEFLHRNFGTEKVEEIFSGMLDSDFMHIIHVNLSNVVLQYCQPIVKEGTWYDLVQKNGSFIHNLNFCVDNIEDTVKKYQDEGIEYIFQQKLRPDDENFFYMMRSLDRLGFHMEHGQMPKGEIPKGFLFNDLIKE